MEIEGDGARTSRLLTSETPLWKPTTLSRRPSTIALRCRATPYGPTRALLWMWNYAVIICLSK